MASEDWSTYRLQLMCLVNNEDGVKTELNCYQISRVKHIPKVPRCLDQSFVLSSRAVEIIRRDEASIWQLKTDSGIFYYKIYAGRFSECERSLNIGNRFDNNLLTRLILTLKKTA